MGWTDQDCNEGNILTMQIIKLQLKKLNMIGLINSYYISQVRIRVLVDDEMDRFLCGKEEYDKRNAPKQRSKLKSKLPGSSPAAGVDLLVKL